MKKMLAVMLIASTIFTSVPTSLGTVTVKAEETESMTGEVVEETESVTGATEEMVTEETESVEEAVTLESTEETESETESTENTESTISVSLDVTEAYLAVGTGKELAATITGNEENEEIVWTSSNESVATVDDMGYVTAVAKGTADITVTVGEATATAAIHVEEVALNQTEAELTVGETLSLSVSGTTQSITWESADKSIATIDSNGTVTALKAGNVIIYASVDGALLECELNITEAPSITLNKSKMYLAVGCSGTLQETTKNTDESVKWTTSDKSIATVDSDGVVKAVKTGTATITAKCGKVSASCTVYVENPSFSKTSMYLAKGVSTTLKISGTKQTAKWSSSDTSIVTVDKNGTVKAVKKGTTTVTAKVDGKKLKCKIKVEDPSISNKYVSLKKGKTATLSVSGTKQTVKWSSSDKSIAKVNKNGKVTAVAKGKATITAKVDGKKLKCTIYVESLSLNTTNEYLAKGGAFTLKVKGAADTSGAKYSSSDKSIVTVDKNGKVTGKKTGTATITVKLHGKKMKCKIKVENPKISATTATISVKGTTTLKVTKSSKKVTWSTSDKSIATVDKNGKVTGVKKGTATITAKVEHKKIKCTVTVENPKLSKTSAKIYLGAATKLKVSGTSQTVTWSTSDKSIAKVNKSGKVTGVGKGTATITAKVGGKKLKCTVTVKKRVATYGGSVYTDSDYLYIDQILSDYFYHETTGVTNDASYEDLKKYYPAIDWKHEENNIKITRQDVINTLEQKYPEIDWYFEEGTDSDIMGDKYFAWADSYTEKEFNNKVFIDCWSAGEYGCGFVYGLYRY